MSTDDAVAGGGKIVRLRSCDGEDFEVEEKVWLQFKKIDSIMIKDGCPDNAIPLPYISSSTLNKVIEYCTNHSDDTKTEEELKTFDSQLVNVDMDGLFDLIEVASYLGIMKLKRLACDAGAAAEEREILRNTPWEVICCYNFGKNRFRKDKYWWL